mmetsp:Transcript_631/g.1522  ORF Transcript_631/g.1522 Transcript_631/m.1522 type:complete len:308 (-) Transcript_631:2061-2984(-)
MLPSAPPLISLNRASSVIVLAFMCSPSTEARTCVLLCTRNSRPPSSSKGAQVAVVFVICSSRPASFSLVSARIFFDAYFCSCSLDTFLDLASAVATSAIWVCILLCCSFWASVDLLSFDQRARDVRAPSSCACASLDSADSFSPSAYASSSLMGSGSSLVRGSTASASFLTSASAAMIFSDVSCICAVFFRPSVSFLKLLSLPAAALMRSDSVLNSARAGFDTASAKCFASRFLAAMKVLALLMAVCAVPAAASDSLIVSVASFSGRISMPLRKGSSASLTLSRAASTSSTFLPPSLTCLSHCTRSR